jgi:hypothetical protein
MPLPTIPVASKDTAEVTEDDPLVDGPIVRHLVVALVCSGACSTLVLALLMSSAFALPR